MDLTFIIIVIIILTGIWFALGSSGKKEESIDGLIRDEDIDALIVLYHLEGFKPVIRADRKNGFTEKDIHDQLEAYLKNIFHSVTKEHAIDGKNVKRIDFDLGNGMVGIEVKLAESVLKEGENDRLIGQMQKYISRKYNNKNFIIALAGFSTHTRNTIIHELKSDVEKGGGYFVFMKSDA